MVNATLAECVASPHGYRRRLVTDTARDVLGHDRRQRIPSLELSVRIVRTEPDERLLMVKRFRLAGRDGRDQPGQGWR